MEVSYRTQYADLWANHWWWQARHRLVVRQVAGLLAGRNPALQRPTILDVGCAGGFAFDDWSRFGDVYGLEPDPVLARSVPRWRDRIEVGKLDRDYHCRRRYDLVLLLDVLEHIDDDEGALQNIRRLLKPGGHVLLTVPAGPLLWSAHDEANHHFRRYRRGKLRRLLQRQRLEPLETEYFFTWSVGLMYLRSWLAGSKRSEYRVKIPPWPLNACLRSLSCFEQWLAERLSVRRRFGSSLLAIGHRPQVND